MRYGEALEFIHGIERFGSKPGLKRVSMLLERMGNPQDGLEFIHVAGTNGKGSVCAMLSHILARAGYKTGLYISPFVIDFCERIQINNEMIPEEEIAASVTLVKSHWDALAAIGEPPTEFEVVTAVAMDCFSRMRCDAVVLEVGMGGQFDATNVIKTPLVSVITSIGVDHTEYLGDTIREIAFEKCGIIKQNGMTVSYPRQTQPALEVIMEQCAEKQNELLMGVNVEILSMDITGSDIRYNGLELRVPLAGEHQVYNTVTVLETLKALRRSGFAISGDTIINGIFETRFPARAEILSRDPLVILDGAHNVSGAQALAETISSLLKGRRIHAIVGAMRDKEILGMLKAVLPHCVSATTVAPENPRAMPAGDLARLSMPYCDYIYIAGSCAAAFIQSLAHCAGDDVILIFGSLYLAAEMRSVAMNVLAKLHGQTESLQF